MALQSKNTKGVADLVFCVDSTGSMSPCIDALKAELLRFITELEAPPEQGLLSIQWRMRFLGFRDLFDSSAPPWINADQPMVSTPAEARAQLAALNAQGGGDEPESTLDAIWQAAASTDWRRPCNRIVILFSDATAHPTLHPDTVGSGAVGDDVDAVVQALVANNCRLHAWAPRCPVWDRLSCAPRVVYTPMTDAGSGFSSLDFSELMRSLRKTVSQISTEGTGFSPGMTTPLI
jgi:hypothetical protein